MCSSNKESVDDSRQIIVRSRRRKRNTSDSFFKTTILSHSHLLLLLLSCIIISQLPSTTNAFNLENRLPIVKYGANPRSYFGYSIATHRMDDTPVNTNWILVGAPLDKNLQPGTNSTGALWKCPITQNTDDCTQVLTDGRRLTGGAYNDENTFDVDDLQEPTEDEIKEDQWLGVTVRSQGPGGKVLVCAHRYVLKVSENRYGQGLCYVLTNQLEYDESYEPCKGRPVQRNHEDYGVCQAGTSGALFDDESMVLGTPGTYTWRGALFLTQIGGDYLARDKTIYNSDHLETSSPVDKYSYLGMAVTGGRYFSDRHMSYAAGAPRSKEHGQVVIFDKASKNPIPVRLIINGEQFGASFGYELTTADINGDSKPDLIVSAPFYFGKTEGGAVYIYQNDKDMLPTKPTLKLTGTVESRFGLALANIGDINKDFCDDLAIGAPYEGNGVVYIYLGSAQGLLSKPAQRIAASDLGMLPQPVNTFGSSITGGIDLDDNSYPDVVVGAYNSSAVVALLARPIIHIQTTSQDSEMKNIDPTRAGCLTNASTNLTCFTFEACCSLDPYEQISANKDLRLRYTIEAETFGGQKKFSRVFFLSEGKRSNVIREEVNVRTNGKVSCHRVTAYIKENTRDIQSPIRFRLNYTIVESQLPISGLEALNPILDQTQSSIEFEGTFQKDCGDNDICESNMLLSAEMDLNMENENYALMLGAEEEIRVNVNVSNTADAAYEAQLFIVHQKSVSYIATTKTNSAICSQFNDTVVACTLGNPMSRGASIQLSIRFDPVELEVDETTLTFHVFANTTSKLIGLTKPEKRLNVTVIKRANLSVQGWTQPEQSFYSGLIKKDDSLKEMDDAGLQILHTYQIYNEGPWRAPKVTLTIYWPHQMYSNRHKKDKFLLYLEDLPVIENPTQGQCYVASDHINPLKLISKLKPNLMDQLLMGPAPYMMRPSNRSRFSSRLTAARMHKKLNDIDENEDKQNENYQILRRLNRVRRDMIARIIRPERFKDTRDIKNKKRDIIELDCDKGTANCIKIHCDILNMQAKTEAYVHVKARLWNSTLMSEFPGVDMVRIMSNARVKIPPEFNVDYSPETAQIMVETRIYPEWLDQQRDTTTPLWIIILAIIGGLLLLALFTYVMWKCGFFKRRRPDPTLSGNLEKMNEEKPFISSKNNSRIF